MSFFSDSVKVVTTATPNFTVDSYEGPNVGQYGWTKADNGHYNQLIQYVDECKRILEQVKEYATGIPIILEYIEEIKKIHNQILDTQKEIEDSLVVFEANYRDFMLRYEEFKTIYQAFQNQYVDFLNKSKEIIDEATRFSELSNQYAEASKAYSLESKTFSLDSKNYSIVSQNHSLESLSYANTSKAHSDTSLSHALESSGFADISESWYKKSEELYEELRKGQVYRGSWNPHSGAWPDNGGTNSVWDVTLNEGDADFTWNNITWHWGDRLVYIKDTNSYQQIASGKGVLSVNGKTGSVSINYEDVAAVAAAHRGNWDTTGNVVNNVVGQLAWKNYGANHVIFDASKGTSPANTTIDPVNSQNVWNSSYPTLMGWNGSHTYGVRVDSSRHADVAASASFANDLRGGTISTQGRDLVIDGKRALVGINSDETLYINYSADYPNVTFGGNLHAAAADFSRILVLNNGSSSYGDAGIEVRVGDGATQTPRISMHRPGVNGSAFALGADGTVTLESTTPSTYCNFRAGAFYSSVPATSADQLTRKDYVDGLIGSRTNFVNRGQRSDVNITNGEGSYVWHPSVANNPFDNSFAHGLSFGGHTYQDGQWVSDITCVHGKGLYHRAVVNGGFGTWDKFAFAGGHNQAENVTRFENTRDWFGAAFSAANLPAVVAGSLSGYPTIGGHVHALNGWSDLYVNAQAGHGGTGGTVLGNPHAMEPGVNAVYKMYHTGFKPTAAEVGALSLNGGTVNGTIRKAGGGDFIVADQGGVVNRELQIYNNGGDAVFRSDLNQDGDSAGTFTFVGAKLSTSAQFEPKAPSTTATSLSHLTGNSSPIRFPNVQAPKVATTYVEMLHGSSQVTDIGYIGHLSIGAKRSNTSDWGSAYIAYGGSDGYPTKEWIFQSTTGNFESPGTIFGPSHIIHSRGGLSNTAPNGEILQDSSLRILSEKNLFIDSVDGTYLGSNFGHSNNYGWHKRNNSKASGYLRVTADPAQLAVVYSKAGASNPNESTYKIYHAGNKPTAEEIGAASGGYAYAFPGGNDVNQNLRTSSGFFNASSATNRPSWPMGGTHTWDYYYNAAHANASGYNGVIAMDFNGQGLAFKAISAGADKGWKYVYHTGFKPSAADIGALPSTGGAVQGSITVSGQMQASQVAATSDIVINGVGGLAKSGSNNTGLRCFSNDYVFIDAAQNRGVFIGNNFTFDGTWKKRDNAHASSMISIESGVQTPKFFRSDAGNSSPTQYSYNIYHTGYKPTAADVGALPITGGNISAPLGVTGELNIYGVSDSDLGDIIWYNSSGVERGRLWLSTPNGETNALSWRTSSSGPTYKVYHTGNKPTAADVGALPTTGGNATGAIGAPGLGINNTSTNSGVGLSLYGSTPSSGAPAYGMMFSGTATYGTHGSVTSDWATYFTMGGSTSRGWIFKSGNSGGGNVASISATGDISTSGRVAATGEIYTNGSFKASGTLQLINNTRSIRLNAENTPEGICYFNMNDGPVRPIEFFDEGFIRVNPQHGKGVDRERSGAADIWNQFHASGIAAVTYGMNGGYHFAINQSNGAFGWVRTLMAIEVNSGNMQLSAAGYASGGFHTGSDIRFKDKIETVSREGGSWLDKVCSLSASTFVYKDKPETPRLGFIAQEVQDVIPDAITAVEVNRPGATETNDMVERLFLDPMAIIAAQNEAIKELVEKFNALEERLKVLEGLS